MFEIKVV